MASDLGLQTQDIYSGCQVLQYTTPWAHAFAHTFAREKSSLLSPRVQTLSRSLVLVSKTSKRFFASYRLEIGPGVPAGPYRSCLCLGMNVNR